MRVPLKLKVPTAKRLDQVDIPLMLGEFLLAPHPLKPKKNRNVTTYVNVDGELIEKIRGLRLNLPFTEVISLLVESKLSGASEELYRAKLRGQIGGEIEVVCPAGKIDLLTPCNKLIEVKKSARFTHALGQVLSYWVYYPGYDPYVALFGARFYNRKMVETVCETYKVGLIWICTSDDSLNWLKKNG